MVPIGSEANRCGSVFDHETHKNYEKENVGRGPRPRRAPHRSFFNVWKNSISRALVLRSFSETWIPPASRAVMRRHSFQGLEKYTFLFPRFGKIP